MRTLLVDGDIWVHSACAATEFDTEWEPDLWVRHGNLAEARVHFERSMSRIMDELEGDRMMVALSCPFGRWREHVSGDYKSNRSGRKPVHYRPLREWIHETYDTHEKSPLEGDDVLGILSTHPGLGGEKIIVSIDKDMKTIPGLLCNPDKGWDVVEVSTYEADYNHMFQTLTGDTTDGYKGCPGIGPVKAEKVLSPAPRIALWDLVVDAYASKNLGEEVALLNARLARILRYEDWDEDTQEVRLWIPPSAKTVGS